jgi:hypothetical protein
MELIFGNKMRHNDGNRFIRLAAGENFLDVIQQWLQEETIRGIHDDETVAPSPPLPFLLNLFCILRLQGDMNGCDIF